MQKILIIDDEPDLLWTLSNVLKEAGYLPITAQEGWVGMEKVKTDPPDLVILDLKLPDQDGTEVLKQIKEMDKELPVIILTAFGGIPSAVHSIKLGAFDYLTKPVPNEELLLSMERAFQAKSLQNEVEALRQQIEKGIHLVKVVGESKAIQDTYSQALQVAPTELTVILEGESGTGKEVIAHFIHRKSRRREKPFITVDCGTIPESLMESELFGYEKGAFTGADKKKLGQFELAQHGTIFLDEIGNLPSSSQAKLLRVLEERTIQHLGGKKEIMIDVRVIAASNIPLSHLVRDGKLREDLFHRLNQFSLSIPPLRERKEDIIPLGRCFLKESNRELCKNVQGFSREVEELFLTYSWPGNVRELKNVVKRSVLLAEEKILLPHLPHSLIPSGERSTVEEPSTLPEATEKLERRLIREALINAKGNKAKAAKMLDIDRKTLYIKMEKYGLE